jgi:RimJ/RimL family protein N-acetyltransferase
MRRKSTIKVLAITDKSRDWVKNKLKESWGSTKLVSRGIIHNGDQLPGLIAYLEGEPVGLCTYRIDNKECELVSLNSFREKKGVGTDLINRVITVARNAGCFRVWLITSNDNLHALKFYQKFGFRLVAVYPEALDLSRKLKPEIPLVGLDGIPLRDEIELEFRL